MRTIAIVIIGSLVAAAQLACRDSTPPPRHVPVPGEFDRRDPRVYRHDERRPLPPPEQYSPADYPPFEDAPLLAQQPPEQRRFVEAYDAVGRPRIVVFMNRTMDGQIIPVVEHEPIAAVEHRRRSTTGVTVERSDRRTTERGYRYEGRDTTDRFESTGPADYTETTEVYLPRGRYDEAMARSLDYEAMEHTLTDWLAAGGRVVMISPGMARQRLTDEQLKELQDGRPQMLSELAEQLNADILVQVQARPTRQARDRLEIRVVAEAINTRGGESIGRAFVDVPLPLAKPQINHYTRYLARKLMDDMTGAWSAPVPPREPAPQTNPPPQQ